MLYLQKNNNLYKGWHFPTLLWDVGQMAKLTPFHGVDASPILARPIYDFVAKLVKASDCNSEGVSSTLTEIFSCGKPDAKTYFLDAYGT